MDLKEREFIGDGQARHWYYVSKFDALMRCLDRAPGQVLDVGAGSGFFARRLLERTSAQGAVCVNPGYEIERVEHVGEKPLAFVRQAEPAGADVVLLMDVIEHADDDAGLLSQYVAPAQAGTRFVISVPAFAWLWSPHDEYLEHRRRYTRSSLIDALGRGGLRADLAFYFYAGIFPAAAAVRLWRGRRSSTGVATSDMRPVPTFVNGVLTSIGRAEALVARHNRLFGLTVFAAATKT